MRENLIDRNRESTAAPTGADSVKMRIDQSASHHVIKAIINLYTKPEEAVLRESTSNARDSRRKAGTTRPIEVTLPTYDEPNLTVEDWGLGMNWDDVVTVYSGVGTSTKKDDNSQTGAFGFGSKAPLMLCDRFDMVAVKDGIMTVFYCVKDALGVGEFVKVLEAETDKPNGFKITIPVSRVEAFDAESLLDNFFIGYETGSILINGFQPRWALDNEDQFKELHSGTDVVGWMSHSTKKSSYYDSNVYAIVSDVVYPVKNDLYNAPYSADLLKLKQYGRVVYLDLPNGSVHMPPTREELTYDETTNTTIANAFKDVVAIVELEAQRRIEQAKTKREALDRYADERASNLWSSAALTYRGEAIPVKIKFNIAAFHLNKVKQRSGIYQNKLGSLTNATYDLLTFRSEQSVIVVVDAKDDMMVGAKVDGLKRRYNKFVAARGEASTNLFFTRSADNEWLKAAATEIITEAEYLEYVTRGAKVQAETRVATPKSKDAYYVFTGVNKDRSTQLKFALTPVDQIAPNGEPVVLVHRATAKLAGSGKFANLITTNLNRHHEVYSDASMAKALGYLEGYKLVFLHNASGVEKFKRHFPDALNGEQIVREIARTEFQRVVSLQGAETTVALLTDSNVVSWGETSRNREMIAFAKQLQAKGMLGQIKDVQLQAFLKEISYERPADEKLEYDALLLAWAGLSVKSTPEHRERALALNETAKRFKLFPTTAYFDRDEEIVAHVIDYMNSVRN